jgi:nitrogen fixation-related uncharacterized protein
MRRRLNPFAWWVAAAIAALLVVGTTVSGVAQAPQQKPLRMPGLTQVPHKKAELRPRLTPLQRLDRSLAKSPRQDVLTPAVMHSIERHLQGATDLSDMDRLVRRALLRHPDLGREVLQRWVANWKAIPPATKAKLVPAELRSLDPARKMDMSLFRAAVGRDISQRAKATGVDWGSARASLGAALDTTENSRRPHITDLAPADSAGVPSFRWGQTFTINGRHFSKDAGEIRIHFLRYTVTGTGARQVARFEVVKSISPKASGPTSIRAEIPKPVVKSGGGPRGLAVDSLRPGRYYVQVQTAGYGKSNVVPFELEPPAQLPPPTVITGFEPASAYPGQEVIIRGTNFPTPEHLWWDSLDYEGVYYHWMPVQSSSATELRLTLPQDMLPGTYRLTANGARAWSDWKTFTVRAPLYKVTFDTLKCLDESDPEANVSDEIVTMWAIAADGFVWTKKTGEYDDFDDGDERTYRSSDRVVYSPEGPAREVRNFLYIRTALYEWDYGTAEAGEAVFGFCSDLMDAMDEYLGDGAIIGMPMLIPFGVVGLICELVDTIINWFGGEPDALGKIPMAWSAVQLQLQTANPSRSFSGVLDFNNDDDTGSYRVRYTVSREEPR